MAQAVAFDAGVAGVDHITDAGYRERGFGHVGGQHNAALPVGRKNAVLLGLAQAGKQGQHLGTSEHWVVCQVFLQVVGCFADFALTGQKHQHVAVVGAATPQFVHAVGDG